MANEQEKESVAMQDTLKGETVVFLQRDWIAPGAVEFRAHRDGVKVPNELLQKVPADAYWLDAKGEKVFPKVKEQKAVKKD